MFLLSALIILPASLWAATDTDNTDVGVTLYTCNNNAVCDAGENATYCSADCGATCGNSIIEAGEQCDNGGSNGSCPASCSTGCQNNSCGGGSGISFAISGVTSTNITYNSAVISWTTNNSAVCQLSWGLNTSYSDGSSNELIYSTSHSSAITGLSGNSQYYFKIVCNDQTGGSATSENNTFTTLTAPDITPPGNVSGLRAVPGNTLITLYWQNPIDSDFAGVIIRRSESAFPGLDDGVLVYDGLGNPNGLEMSFEDTGLTNGTLYYYTVFAYDVTGNKASGASVSDLPTGLANVIGLRAVSSDRQIVLYWQNPVYPGFAEVVIRRSLTAFPNFDQGNLIYQGLGNIFGSERRLVDLNLTNDLDYYYTVFTLNNLGDHSGGSSVVGRPSTTTTTTTPPITTTTPPFTTTTPPFTTTTPPLVTSTLPITTTTPTIIDLYFKDFNFYQEDGSLPVSNEDSVEISEGLETKVVLIQSKVPAGTDKMMINLSINGKVQSYLFARDLSGDYVVFIPAVNISGRYWASITVLDANDAMLKTVSGWFQATKPKVITEIVIPAIINERIKAVKDLAKSPIGQAAAAATMALSIINLVAAVPWWNLWYLLQFLFTQPLLLFRKRKGWGTVYNSITKRPIDLALVRLYDATTDKLIASKVTDRDGRYIFLVDAGRYYLKVEKPNFDFPSVLLKNKTDDGRYLNLYYGKEIVIKSGERAAIIANIPIDQKEIKISDTEAIRNFSRQRALNWGSWLGPIVAIVYFVLFPSWFAGALVMVHLFLLWYFRRLSIKRSGRNWGLVFDKWTRRPLKKAVTRIFSSEYGRMLEFYVTDSHGRYGFLVSDNKYYVTADKEGYQTTQTPIVDLTGKNLSEQKIVAQNIGLVKLKNSTTDGISNQSQIETTTKNIEADKLEKIIEPLPIDSNESVDTTKPLPKELITDSQSSIPPVMPTSFDLGSIAELKEDLNIAPETDSQKKAMDLDDKSNNKPAV